MLKFYVKNFYMMGKVLSGELSCPCDRSYFIFGLKIGKENFLNEYGNDFVYEISGSFFDL